MRQIKDETNSYLVGEMACVAVYFKKKFNGSGANLSFDSKIKRFLDEWEGQSAYIDIDDLEYVAVDWLNEKEPNTHKLFSTSKAQLVISYGRQEWQSKNSSPHGISISDGKAFITWQVESMEYLNGIANAINANEELSVRIEIACNDIKIGERLNEKVIKEDIYKISVMFDK
ncbi:hypothetical protein G6730_06975 [Polynucleobacter paneuropaeus]|nr:hypothetical protein [Polynucleobacter paneuropaeus]